MAIKANNLTKKLVYVSADDPAKGSEDETRFHLRPLASWQVALVNDMLSSFEAPAVANAKETPATMRVHQAALLAVQFALDDWDNFLDGDGVPIQFDTISRAYPGRAPLNIVKPALLDAIPFEEVFGMYQMLMETANPSAQQAKN